MLDRAIWKNKSESVSKYFKPTTGEQRWELRGGCRVSLLLYVVDEYKIKLMTQTFSSGYFWAKQMTQNWSTTDFEKISCKLVFVFVIFLFVVFARIWCVTRLQFGEVCFYIFQVLIFLFALVDLVWNMSQHNYHHISRCSTYMKISVWYHYSYSQYIRSIYLKLLWSYRYLESWLILDIYSVYCIK